MLWINMFGARSQTIDAHIKNYIKGSISSFGFPPTLWVQVQYMKTPLKQGFKNNYIYYFCIQQFCRFINNKYFPDLMVMG